MSSRRDILVVNEFYHPDICATAAVLADRLPRLARLRPDHRITVIAGNRAWNDPDRVYAPADEHRGIRILRVARPSVNRDNLLDRMVGVLAFQRAALRSAKQLDPPDLVIATTAPPQGGAIGRKIGRHFGVPYIYTVWDLYPDLVATLGRMREGSFLFRRLLAANTAIMRDAARVVCIGQGITDRVTRTRRIERGKLATIHDGFDPARLELRPASQAHGATFAEEFNPEGRFTVQYAGNMGLSHPFDSILDACEILIDDPDITFQFIGDGPRRAEIVRRRPRNARLIPYQPDDRLGEVIHSADVCLIAQDADMYDQSLPYKVYGIFAAGRPAIFVGNQRSEIAEWMVRQGVGLQVDQGDAVGLAHAIRTLKADRKRADEMGTSARRLLDDSLTSEAAAEKWAELIDEVLS